MDFILLTGPPGTELSAAGSASNGCLPGRLEKVYWLLAGGRLSLRMERFFLCEDTSACLVHLPRISGVRGPGGRLPAIRGAHLPRKPGACAREEPLFPPGMVRSALRTCKKTGIGNWLKPEHLNGYPEFTPFLETGAFSHRLLLALLPDIFTKVRSLAAADVDEGEAVLIPGSDMDELRYVLAVLAPHIRYATVVAGPEGVEAAEVDRICDDTGLSVGLVSDAAGVLRNASLAVYLGRPAILPRRTMIRRSAVVLDFCPGVLPEGLCGGTVITGVDVGFGDHPVSGLMEAVKGYYGSLQVAGIALAHMQDSSTDSGTRHDAVTFEGVRRRFLEQGGRITGYRGLHGVLQGVRTS